MNAAAATTPAWATAHPLHADRDVSVARRRAKEAGQAAGLDEPTCARLAAAVSELCRNAIVHGGGGELAFSVTTGKPARLIASVRDRGSGVPDLGAALEATRGTGGLARAQRLLGSVKVQALDEGGTLASVSVPIPREGALALIEQAGLDTEGHGAPAPTSSAEDAAALRAEVHRLREELNRVERELEETNRGVVAV
jgi:serine/threonine-protein kinase RsbT